MNKFKINFISHEDLKVAISGAARAGKRRAVSTQCEQGMLDLDGRKSFIQEVNSAAAAVAVAAAAAAAAAGCQKHTVSQSFI